MHIDLYHPFRHNSISAKNPGNSYLTNNYHTIIIKSRRQSEPRATIILGTRPEIIKMSPVIREFEQRGMEYLILATGQGNKATVIIQTGLTGSTGCVLSYNPVILSGMKKPQMKIIRPGTRMPRIKRIYMDSSGERQEKAPEHGEAMIVSLSRINKPQINADERRFAILGSSHGE